MVYTSWCWTATLIRIFVLSVLSKRKTDFEIRSKIKSPQQSNPGKLSCNTVVYDKLRNYYRIYLWVRNRKWRWYILFWDVSVTLENLYTINILIHNMHSTTRKHIWSHHDFIKAISRAWINLENIVQNNFKVSHKYHILEEKEHWTCVHLVWCQQWHQTDHEKYKSAP